MSGTSSFRPAPEQGLPIVEVELGRERFLWTNGDRGDTTFWIEYDVQWMENPGGGLGERIAWPTYRANAARISSLLPPDEAARVLWEFGVWDDDPRIDQPFTVEGLIVAIGCVYRRSGATRTSETLVKRSLATIPLDPFKDQEGRIWESQGVLVELVEVSGLPAPH